MTFVSINSEAFSADNAKKLDEKFDGGYFNNGLMGANCGGNCKFMVNYVWRWCKK